MSNAVVDGPIDARADVGVASVASLLPAPHQPDWCDRAVLDRVRTDLATRPGITRADDVALLHRRLALLSAGQALVIQAGDCAEDPADCTPAAVQRRAAQVRELGAALGAATGRAVLTVGRIAGQYAKPRSRLTEIVGGTPLPVYRGHMINSPVADPSHRRHDPVRMVGCYAAAARTATALGWRGANLPPGPVWTSHEALVLDYERALVRMSPAGPVLASTHWPWIGERTRVPGGAHVSLLAAVSNPVAVKVGPSTDVAGLLLVCDQLDPARSPGRLTLIARFGSTRVTDRLPELVLAVRRAGHPVVWLCDPMHGNGVVLADGTKTRYMRDILAEVERFVPAVRAGGGVAAGLHLETTPDDVIECLAGPDQVASPGSRYLSLCDPRLTPSQSFEVVAAFAAAWGAPA